MSVFGAIGDFISGLFSPAAELIDNVHTSTEEKLQLKNKFAEIQATIHAKSIGYETKIRELEYTLRAAELKSTHFLAANWRPMCALAIVVTMIGLAIANKPIPPALSSLATVFLPGYAVARTVEKIQEKKSIINKYLE